MTWILTMARKQVCHRDPKSHSAAIVSLLFLRQAQWTAFAGHCTQVCLAGAALQQAEHPFFPSAALE